MREREEIRRCVLDADGTTRDITFTPVTAERVLDFLNSLRSVYRVVTAKDADGNDISRLFASDIGAEALTAPQGYMHAVLGGPAQIIPVLQVFLDWPMDDRGYGVELSFFPNDLEAKEFQLDPFMELIEEWRSVLGADNYFVRYENASWDWYDADGLGVIYAGAQLLGSKSC